MGTTIMTTAAEILKGLETAITPEMVKKVKGIFAFDIAGNVFTVDLKKEGKMHKGKVGKPDCTLIMSEEVFIDLFTGKMNAQKGFMQGKYKIKGNIMASQKLQALTGNAQSEFLCTRMVLLHGVFQLFKTEFRAGKVSFLSSSMVTFDASLRGELGSVIGTT